MLTARRVLVSVTIAALLLLGSSDVRAAGGVFPQYPGQFGFSLSTSTPLTAVIVLDPNGPVTTAPPATSTGTIGAIAITRGGVGTATAAFRVEPDSSLSELRFGCNLLLTNPRFVEFAPGVPGLTLGGPTNSFFNWLPPSITLKLFNELGVSLVDQSGNVLAIPGVAGVISQRCVPFPKANADLDLTLFKAVIQDYQLPTAIAGPLKGFPPSYPDRTIAGSPPADQQWVPGILVLQVTIGLWQP